MIKEHWKFQGAWLALDIHPEVDGQRCYWFRRENIGVGGTTLIIPISRYWRKAYSINPQPQRANASGADHNTVRGA